MENFYGIINRLQDNINFIHNYDNNQTLQGQALTLINRQIPSEKAL